jgi:hypothetical protein
MRLEIIASAALIAVLSALAPVAAADDKSGTGADIRLAQAEGPMVITPKPYANQPGTYSSPPGENGYDSGGPGTAYEPAPQSEAHAGQGGGGGSTFTAEEIKNAGHRFFGRVSMEFARVVEYAFQRAGRPNGYILGEEAGGAFVAGLRYGEGTLHTKDAGNHRVFWQGPSLGYDFGAEGSKTMVLVYDLRSPGQIFTTYAGVDGSAYFIGGVGVTFLARDHVTLAPIRSGLGLRLGANIGYLKYTREPTWNPF